MPNEPITDPISSETMSRWNRLIQFAKQKGYSGMEALNHDEKLRKRVFDEYNAANPDSPVDYSIVKDVQNEIQKYKQKALQAIQSGKGSYSGSNLNNFMSGTSKVDGVFGSKTSSWEFPSAYIKDASTGELKKVGFAPKVDMAKALSMSK